MITTNRNDAKVTENAEKYSVEIESLKKGEEVELSYDMAVAKNLSYNLNTETGYAVKYTNNATSQEKSAKATTLLLSTGTVAQIESSLKAQVAEEDITNGAEVKAGEIITYIATVSNKGTQNAENVNVEFRVPENTTLIQVNPRYNENFGMSNESVEKQEYFIAKENNAEKINVEAGKTVSHTYMVRVNSDVTEARNVKAEFITTEEGKEPKTAEFNNKIVGANLIVTLTPQERAEENLKQGYEYPYMVSVQNLSDSEQKNVQVTVKTNDTTIKNIFAWSP